MNKWILCLVYIVVATKVIAQPYAPSADDKGTTALFKDSAVFITWASSAFVERGAMDISNPSLGLVTFGEEDDVLGKADGRVISLGDKGAVTLRFESPISDGDGADFAVFENSFNNTFLELAFVEVSSDGKRFIRFPSTSLSQYSVQFGNDAFMDPTQLNNLAGKYRGSYGTPFDLSELKDSTGIDLESITHIKLIDVVGSIDQKFGSSDSHNNLINDPYPTPYPSGGFDLDAVGVIHSNVLSTTDLTVGFRVYPNPTTDFIYLQLNKRAEVALFNITGQLIENKMVDCNGFLDLSKHPKGTYYLCMEDKQIRITRL